MIKSPYVLRLFEVIRVNVHLNELGSISSTFYEQLLCAQIPNAPIKAALRTLMKLTPKCCFHRSH